MCAGGWLLIIAMAVDFLNSLPTQQKRKKKGSMGYDLLLETVPVYISYTSTDIV